MKKMKRSGILTLAVLLLAALALFGMLGEERQAELICWSNSTRRNINTEHTAMVISVALLVP